ncbi:hypothetical protein DI487_07600 [Flavobacterium sediminis]|uniref:SnoaL-like domain-containing protein n=1 Tax=Flavobacterium sediminis TaxID=2201181 RepID=A0A2U8QU66_9FLAO|nr:nuclear transport factor 2 family protein [Flavobacterium sediminis]AWM13740.1 hypothetical protein DI487_07600 [Flavobacterium sediminis]
MFKKGIFFLIICSLFSFQKNISDDEKIKKEINQILDNWHAAAGRADFDAYFHLLSDESIYIGTDATENWTKKEFMAFAKPYFDRGKAWNFIALERHIYLSSDKKTVWFDELLDTQMKLCRGSGILIREKGEWKIKHYVLSMTIPNENAKEVVTIKSPLENKILESKN